MSVSRFFRTNQVILVCAAQLMGKRPYEPAGLNSVANEDTRRQRYTLAGSRCLKCEKRV